MNRAKLNAINAKIERGEMDNGHWFCACCQRITELNLDGPSAGVCAICSSPRVKWHDDQPASASEARHGHAERQRVPVATAHRWFEAARQVVEQAKI